MVEPVVAPARTTSVLLRFLAAALMVIALATAVLTYAYLRVADQLDKTRRHADCSDRTVAALVGQGNDAAVVLGRLNELASAFAQLSSPDAAVREQARQRLAAIAAEPPPAPRSPSSTAPASTTSTTTVSRPPSSTTTRGLLVLPTLPPLPLQLTAADPCTTRRGTP